MRRPSASKPDSFRTSLKMWKPADVISSHFRPPKPLHGRPRRRGSPPRFRLSTPDALYFPVAFACGPASRGVARTPSVVSFSSLRALNYGAYRAVGGYERGLGVVGGDEGHGDAVFPAKVVGGGHGPPARFDCRGTDGGRAAGRGVLSRPGGRQRALRAPARLLDGSRACRALYAVAVPLSHSADPYCRVNPFARSGGHGGAVEYAGS